jgi:hypothetical protein
MNKVKCVIKKDYRLTLEKEYDVIKKEDGYIFIINDNGTTARYDNSLFLDVEEIQQTITEITVRTEEDCIGSIDIDGNDISYIGINGEVRVLHNAYSTSESSISCGILQVYGINETADRIYDLVNQDEEGLNELAKALFTASLLNYLNNGLSCGAYILSNTTYSDDGFVEILNNISHFKTEEFHNPNSGNAIKMWGFYKNQL